MWRLWRFYTSRFKLKSCFQITKSEQLWLSLPEVIAELSGLSHDLCHSERQQELWICPPVNWHMKKDPNEVVRQLRTHVERLCVRDRNKQDYWENNAVNVKLPYHIRNWLEVNNKFETSLVESNYGTDLSVTVIEIGQKQEQCFSEDCENFTQFRFKLKSC